MMIDHLRSRSTSLQLRGILEAVVHRNVTEAEKNALQDLTKSFSVIGGRTVSEYAIAAQSILGIQKYTGDNPNIIELIQDMPDFMFT